MPSDRTVDGAELLGGFIESLRVEPGSTVKLAKDFDPGYKASFARKKDGAEILAAGVRVLAEHQARLAAQDTWGVLAAGAGRGRQGRHDPPCHERRQPAGRAGQRCREFRAQAM